MLRVVGRLPRRAVAALGLVGRRRTSLNMNGSGDAPLVIHMDGPYIHRLNPVQVALAGGSVAPE